MNFIDTVVTHPAHTDIAATLLLSLDTYKSCRHGNEYCSRAHNNTPSTDDNNSIGGDNITCINDFLKHAGHHNITHYFIACTLQYITLYGEMCTCKANIS